MSGLDFTDQVAVVTGAGRGLGRAYALELGARGATVVVNDVADDHGSLRAERVVEEVRAQGGKAQPSTHDVADRATCRELVAETEETFGSIDVLIHNAGFLRSAPIDQLAESDFVEVLGVHLAGAFHLAQAAWPRMSERGYGRIVLTSSSSILGQRGNANYMSAKAGVLGLVAALASEGAESDILANAVMPFAVSSIAIENPLSGSDTGPIRDSLDAMSDRRSPRSVAPLVVLLASRECPTSGGFYSALAGRYARVFTGITRGWLSPDPEPTAEAIAQNFSTIIDDDEFSIPRSMLDEIDDVRSRIESAALPVPESAR